MKLTLKSKIKMNDENSIPILGLGTWQSREKDARKAVETALEMGYIHIDTAYFYKNEKEVGKGIRNSGIPREDIFVTSKMWVDDAGYDNALKAIDKSLKLLGLDYVDLYLIHWPVANKRIDTWRAFEKIQKDGKARSIGISNFNKRHVDELLAECDIIPAVNQIEVHPFFYDKDLIDFCQSKNIIVEAYSPLARAGRFDNPTLQKISKKYNKSPAQIMIRWGLQHGLVEIPKSTHKNRIKENSEVFDFSISLDDMNSLNALDESARVTDWSRDDNEMWV